MGNVMKLQFEDSFRDCERLTQCGENRANVTGGRKQKNFFFNFSAASFIAGS